MNTTRKNSIAFGPSKRVSARPGAIRPDSAPTRKSTQDKLNLKKKSNDKSLDPGKIFELLEKILQELQEVNEHLQALEEQKALSISDADDTDEEADEKDEDEEDDDVPQPRK